MIKFATHNEVNVFAGIQSFVRTNVTMRANESNLDTGIRFLDLADQLNVAVKSNGGRVKNQKFVALADFDCLLPVDLMWRGVQQPAPGNQSCRIGQPNRIPIGLNLARRGPPRTGPAVEVLKARRIHQQSLHYIRHSAPSVSFKTKFSFVYGLQVG